MNKPSRLVRAWAMTASLALGSLVALSDSATAQRRGKSPTLRRSASVARSAFERGYLAGYQDGFSYGKQDYTARLSRDVHRSGLYNQADRGYAAEFGTMTDYQDGYRLGYEIAYTDGFYGRASTPAVPANAIALRGKMGDTTHGSAAYPVNNSTASGRSRGGTASIPHGTELRVRLTSTLSTKTNHQGDRFTATVLEPRAYEGATVEGHIAKLERSGRLTGRTEISLAFDTITLRDGRTAPLRGQVEKVYASESVKSVDEEGNIETSSRSTDTQIRGAGGAVLGAIIGGIAGGGKGAAIGAIAGAGAGAGSVYVQGQKDLILDVGTEMTVRTSAPQRERLR